MKNMTLKNIAAVCHGLLCNDTDTVDTVSGVEYDSRRVEAGNLFIAMPGGRVDGHSYIAEVAKKGAAAVICEREPENALSIPYILVTDSFKALQHIAAFYRQNLSLPIIGISGSAGKTSTKEFIAAVLGERFAVLKTEGNFNNEIGLPYMVLRIREHHQVAVLEMGISNFGEMSRLARIARPDIAVLTNIGDCHLEQLGDRAGVLRAKSEMFDFLPADGRAVLCGDDELLRQIHTVRGKAPLRFGLGADNDIWADSMENRALQGVAVRIGIKETGETVRVSIPLPGEHMILNALAAAGVGTLLSLKLDEIQTGIAKVEGSLGRCRIVRLASGATIIDDCYNANPLSVQAALKLLADADKTGRKVAILGDMLELGEKKEQLHADIGRQAVASGADVVILIGPLSWHTYAAALVGNDKEKTLISHFPDKVAFLSALADLLRPNDVILLKASRGMGFEELVEGITDFYS